MGTDGAPETVGRAIGRYILFDAIARGGMATVHFGRLSGPVGFSRTVAIKRLHPHLATDPEFVGMFLDEARLAARIRHPNVVPTLDVVAMSGEVFIVMEYVQGESVARLWRTVHGRHERLPLRYTLAALAGALHGLHAAHEVTDEQGHPLNIVHRDVSPQNIIVGTDGVARVLDFGVAKAAGRIAETGDSGSLKGKIAYMAPEHISGQGVTRRTDVYAAAVVLWELLAGERLFDGDSDAQRAAKILASGARGAIPLPSRLNPAVSPAIDAIVMRGLAWQPEERFATAREMAILLEQNGGLVPASELGDWVTGLAAEALAERAGRLHAIEASSRNGKSYPTTDAMAGVEPERSDQTAVVESPPPPVHVAAQRSSWRSVAVIGVLVLVGLGIGVVGWRLGRVPAADARSGAERPPTPPAPSALFTGVTGDSSTIAPSVSAPASTPGTIASKVSLVPPPTPAAKPSNARRVPPKPNDDCDPPYTIDAENHKIYKRNCIK